MKFLTPVISPTPTPSPLSSPQPNCPIVDLPSDTNSSLGAKGFVIGSFEKIFGTSLAVLMAFICNFYEVLSD